MRSVLLSFGQTVGRAALFSGRRLWRHKSVLIPHLVAFAIMGLAFFGLSRVPNGFMAR